MSSTVEPNAGPVEPNASPVIPTTVGESPTMETTMKGTEGATEKVEEGGFFSLKAELPSGEPYEFKDLKGKTVLIVNVASYCGFTPQYSGLQALYDRFKDQGLVVLGFPCNQFLGQEPGSAEDIAKFCELNHHVKFPLMKKSDVNGDNTNEVYKWLKNEKSGLLGLTMIKWNFEKFLVDKNGHVVNRWASTTTPAAIASAIEKIL